MVQKFWVMLCMLMLAGNCFSQPEGSDQDGTYCNVFYLQSDDLEELPFDDVCFVVDRYTLTNPRKFRALGPVNAHIDLFRKYDWAIDFYLPEIREAARAAVKTPKDFFSKNLEMDPGKMFLTISDNRETGRYDPVTDRVDFIAVSGRGTVTSFKPQGPGMLYPEFEMQLDIKFQKIDRSGDYPKLSGNPIRIRMVLIVEALD